MAIAREPKKRTGPEVLDGAVRYLEEVETFTEAVLDGERGWGDVQAFAQDARDTIAWHIYDLAGLLTHLKKTSPQGVATHIDPIGDRERWRDECCLPLFRECTAETSVECCECPFGTPFKGNQDGR